jgi:hypothetical protein
LIRPARREEAPQQSGEEFRHWDARQAEMDQGDWNAFAAGRFVEA